MDKKYYVLIILIIVGAVYLNRNHQQIEYISKDIQFNYTDLETGKVFYYSKHMTNASIQDVLEDYIKELKNRGINYGDEKDNIFNTLKVLSVNNMDGHLIIKFSEDFYKFNEMITEPGYFTQGIHDILSQIKFVNTYSIEIENHEELEIIHPDGLMLKNIPVKKSGE